jgi:putative nucleotidyltransferase with HDIG domain
LLSPYVYGKFVTKKEAMQTIYELEKKLEELPLLPAVIVRLLSLNVSDENYFDQVLELSQEDPTFALRVIRLSNSAFSSSVTPITSLRDAVIRLGVKSVAALVTSMSAIRVFIPNTQGEKNLWVHSIQVAAGSRAIAHMTTAVKAIPEQAYLCGLLHDLGRFVLFDKAIDESKLVENTSWNSPQQLVEIEKEIYGFNHSELGGLVCKKWGLPQIIIDVVANHHTYGIQDQSPRDANHWDLTRIVQMADALSMFMMTYPDAISWAPAKLEEALNSSCVLPLGASPLLSAKQLRENMLKIFDESSRLTFGLGVSPEKKRV